MDEELLQCLATVSTIAVRYNELGRRADAALDYERNIAGDFGFDPMSVEARLAVAEADAAMYELLAAVEAAAGVAVHLGDSEITESLDVALEELRTEGCLRDRTLRRLNAAAHRLG